MPNFISVMRDIAQVKDIKIQAVPGGAKGYFSLNDNEIVVKEGMSDLQTTKTVIHETAHSVVFANKEVAETLDRSDHEIVAESVAYVVCKRFGLDTSEYSFNYVNGWASNDDERIEKCVETISKTAKRIITQMEDKLGLKSELTEKKELYNANAPKKENKKTYSKTKTKQKEIK